MGASTVKKWFSKFFTNEIKEEFDHIQRLATALVKTESTEQTREVIVEECQKILKTDAVCLYILQPKGYYEMIAERNCTQAFKEQWYRLYPEHVPALFEKNPSEPVYYASAKQFKKEFPTAEELVQRSKRKTIAYAPLVVNQKSIGLLGFSYNFKEKPASRQFLSTVVNLCAQALERARLLELERLARKEAEAANRAKTDFLSSISHEIRTPINAIMGFADLIAKSEGLQPSQRDWISRILKNADHLNGLIGDVLDISKIEADKIEIYRHVFSLDEFIDEVKAITTFKAEEKGINLIFNSPRLNLNIHSDAILLRQILINLVSNAIKFTSNNGKIEVNINFDEATLRFEVKDSGSGIAPENRERIFERFTQLDQNQGSGLGLFISKRLSQALGGDLVLKQSTPQGSVFVAFTTCTATSKNEQASKPVARESKKLQGYNFLLVDDSTDNQVLVKCVLANQGAKVDTADNGAIGVKKAFMADYNVIIMDIQMPELDGNEAVSKLRASGYKKPIVALTAEALTSQKQNSLQRGFDEYLPKPIDHELLIKTLGRLATQI
jgi:signal transduction histidine kinase/CheY-like chemotaxis protein